MIFLTRSVNKVAFIYYKNLLMVVRYDLENLLRVKIFCIKDI